MKENSIEEDIKIINNFITYFNKNIQNGNKADLTVLGEEINALEHILSDYKRLLKENEEYSKQLDLDYVDKNYIPKQKIKAKIEELNKTINKGGIIYSLKQCARCQKDVLEKLLIEESED